MAPNRDIVRRTLVESRALPRFLPTYAGRMLDLGVAIAAIVFVSPILIITAIAVALERRGPIFFAHSRIGRHGVHFKVYKFRSMCVDGEQILAAHLAQSPTAAAEWARDHKLRDDPRVTALGRFLRKSSLDELPQLFNVVRGDMSIVGPRPIVQAEVARYGRFFSEYCKVRPGITGIWQVSGRNDVTYRRRVAMDAIYARRKCVALDLKLMLATVPAVVSRKGAS